MAERNIPGLSRNGFYEEQENINWNEMFESPLTDGVTNTECHAWTGKFSFFSHTLSH